MRGGGSREGVEGRGHKPKAGGEERGGRSKVDCQGGGGKPKVGCQGRGSKHKVEGETGATNPKKQSLCHQSQSGLAEQGFVEAISLETLHAHLITAAELGLMVRGCSTSWQHAVRLQDIFHVLLDQQLQQEYHQLAECFWEVSLRTPAHLTRCLSNRSKSKYVYQQGSCRFHHSTNADSDDLLINDMFALLAVGLAAPITATVLRFSVAWLLCGCHIASHLQLSCLKQDAAGNSVQGAVQLLAST